MKLFKLVKNNFFVLLLFFLFFSMGLSWAQNDETTEPKSNADQLAPPKVEKRVQKPVPYDQEAFPDWAYYTYRFSAVAVGAIPFSLLFTTVAYDTFKTIDESNKMGEFQNQYLPLFFSGPDKVVYEDEEVQQLILTTVAVSLSVSIVDLVILLIRRDRGRILQSVFN